MASQSQQKIKCSRCPRTAILMCFCKELAFCQGCIGVHLAEGGDFAHDTVMLTQTDKLAIMRAGASQLNQAREKVICEQQEVLRRKTAALERISKEIEAVNKFEEHTLDLIETITAGLIANLIQTRKAIAAQMKEQCLKIKLQLEDMRVSLSAASESLEVLKSFPALETTDKPLVLMSSAYQEVNIEKLLKEAFRLQVEWALTSGEVLRLLDADSGEVLTLDSSFIVRARDRVPSLKTSSYMTSICLLPKREFLMTGGGVKEQGSLIGALEDAYVVQESLAVSQLSPMNTHRMAHGSIYFNEVAYVVGGWPVNNLCEKYTFSDGKWEHISNLKQGRSYPGICEFEGKIYVAGGFEVDTIEMYIPTQDIFMQLGIRLAAPGRCALVGTTECIVAFHGDNISRILPLKSVCMRERGVTWRADIWPQHPVLQSKEVLLLYIQGRLWRFQPADKDLQLMTDTST